MSVTAAGSSINVQQAMTALRSAVQQEQVAASLVTQATAQVVNSAPQETAHEGAEADGRGEKIDVEA